MAAPLFLTLDTATPRGVLALGRVDAEGPTLLASEEMHGRGRQASAELGARLRDVVARAGARPADIGMVGCGIGPGMFTGVRVAVATAKGIAMGLGVPVVPVSTLAAIACSDDAAAVERLALIDARRGEVYAARFSVTPSACVPRDEARCLPLTDVLAELPATATVAAMGSGVAPYAELLGAHASIAETVPRDGPSAEGLWRASVAALAASAPAEASTLNALYLRASYAELGVNPPKRPFVKSPFV